MSTHLDRLLDATPRMAFVPDPTPVCSIGDFEGRVELLIKHDDAQSFAGGGNKLRKLEFLAAQAKSENADTLVTSGGIQSNHARATAGVAARIGMACHLLLRDMVPGQPPEYRTNGNQVYLSLFGATHEILPTETDLQAATDTTVAALTSSGRRPFVVPFGGSNWAGCLGYVACAREIVGQFGPRATPEVICVPFGSGGTYAGLLAGFHALGLEQRVVGYCVFDTVETAKARAFGFLDDLAGRIGLDPEALRAAVELDDRTLGDGYGLPGPDTVDTINHMGRNHGLVLDPVYTGKAMAGVVQWLRDGRFTSGSRVLFLHTGGQPAVFAYSSTLRREVEARG